MCLEILVPGVVLALGPIPCQPLFLLLRILTLAELFISPLSSDHCPNQPLPPSPRFNTIPFLISPTLHLQYHFPIPYEYSSTPFSLLLTLSGRALGRCGAKPQPCISIVNISFSFTARASFADLIFYPHTRTRDKGSKSYS